MAGAGTDSEMARLVSLASGYYRTMEAAQGSLPESTQLVLRRAVNGERLSWPLALILAGGRITDQGGALPPAFAAAGGDKLVAQLGKFKSALPESYVKFLRAVESGEEAAAASYFQTAISDLAGYIRELLNGFLASEAFLSVARNLVTAVGGPSKPRAVASKPSRYPVVEGNASSLDKAAFLAGRLRAAGWQPAEIERILAGPDRAHLTAERLYRQVAANRPEDQAAFVRTVKNMAPAEVPPASVDPALLQRSSKQLSGTAQLKQGFDRLSPTEQARLVALLQQFLETPDGKPAKSNGGASGPKKAEPEAGIPSAIKSGLDLATALVKGLLTNGTPDPKGTGKKSGVRTKAMGGAPSRDEADGSGPDTEGDKDSAAEGDKDPGTDLDMDRDAAEDEGTAITPDEPSSRTSSDDGEVVPDFINNSEDVID